ncbi:MAG: tyrosine-type recombinase/integrase [Oligoflexia bacterium]|nr:tyrosine-type recombinase/integrase [Oligoflexia bacterium]
MELPSLSDFLSSVMVEGSGSKNTQASYARDLEVFYDFVITTRSEVVNFSQLKLQNFCTKRGLGRRSQARMISTLRSYFRYLQRQGIIKDIPKLEITQHTRTLPETLSEAEIDVLLKACQRTDGNEYRAIRNKAVLVILYATGCRVTELCTLDLMDAQLDMRLLKITGKGSKQRLVPLISTAADALKDYLEIRMHLSAPTEKSLIVNDRGHRPSRIDIFRWLKRWSLDAGFSKNVSPHKLRHTCATQLLKEGVDLRTIQTLLGHASIATTEIYTKIDSGDLKDAVSQFHPLSGVRPQKDV